MTSRQYQAIDGRAAAEIRRLHKRHPKLGRHGLPDALRQAELDIDPDELERSVKEQQIEPERPWRPLRFRGLPAWLFGAGGGNDDE
jgi:hypothetical protein